MRWSAASFLVLAALLGACSGAQGGGGGRAASSLPGAENPHALVRDYMGNAMVSATRVHKLAVQGNYHAARSDLGDVRRQLHLAQQWADPAERDTITGLLARVDLVQKSLESADSSAKLDSADLAQSMFGAYDRVALVGGGGGGPRPLPEPRPRTPVPR
jgi:hypothetical protein